jgi:hypothetical protein
MIKKVALGTLSIALVLMGAGCGGSSKSPSANTATSAAASAPTTAATTATSSAGGSTVVNVWKASGSVALTAVPLGDGHTSTTTAAIGSILVCSAGNPNGPGAQAAGPWLHGTTWDSTAKIAVAGSVQWPAASFTVKIVGTNRVITTNDLPDGYETGTFPIASTDPAYQYDRNPNKITEQSATTLTLPVSPTASAKPNCTPGGSIGVFANGVFLFNGVDAQGRDAVAHEEQDVCQGHPQDAGQYHYHDVPICIRTNAKGTSVVVGWAYDGHPIVVERDGAGNLPNNADLDECHGRTSPVLIDGVAQTIYHYSATVEFPYTIGCLRGTSAVAGR